MSLLWDRMCSVRSQVKKQQLPHTLAWLWGWKLHAYAALCPETPQQVHTELQQESSQLCEAKDPSEQVTFCPKPLHLLTSEDLVPFGLLAWASLPRAHSLPHTFWTFWTDTLFHHLLSQTKPTLSVLNSPPHCLSSCSRHKHFSSGHFSSKVF